VNLDPDTFPPDLRWFVAYFISLIHWKWCCRKENAAGFVQLHSRLLARVIPGGVLKKVKRLLLDRGVIECDREVVIGRKSLGYRLTPDYRQTRRVFCPDEDLNRKIARVYTREARTLQAVHLWLRENFGRLGIDMDRAAAIIAGLKPRTKGRKNPQTLGEYRLQRTELCQRIAGGDHFLTPDDYGRVHTLLTCLHKALRGCLFVRGPHGERLPLVNIDLRNSQPLILGILARQYYGKSQRARDRLQNVRFGGKKNPYHAADQKLPRGASPPEHLSPLPKVDNRRGATTKEREQSKQRQQQAKQPTTPTPAPLLTVISLP
jgi:hypothetical protein